MLVKNVSSVVRFLATCVTSGPPQVAIRDENFGVPSIHDLDNVEIDEDSLVLFFGEEVYQATLVRITPDRDER